MKQIAIVTGATGGIGGEFVKEIIEYQLDEIWCIGRNQDKLEALSSLDDHIKTYALDLSDRNSLKVIKKELKAKKVNVAYLINCVGIGKLGSLEEYSTKEAYQLIDVNVTSVVGITKICLGHMHEGSRIINLCSQSAYQPLPYFNLYAASKAFIKSFSSSLALELKRRKITVLAVFPEWVQTEFVPKEYNGISVSFPTIKPTTVVKSSLKAASKNKSTIIVGKIAKTGFLMSKFLPQNVLARFWLMYMDKNIRNKYKNL